MSFALRKINSLGAKTDLKYVERKFNVSSIPKEKNTFIRTWTIRVLCRIQFLWTRIDWNLMESILLNLQEP